MSFPRLTTAILAAAGVLALTSPGAMALTAKECSAKYKAAKDAKTLGTKTWNDFRKTECGAEGAAATTDTKKAEAPAKTEAPKPEAKKADAAKPAVKPAATAGATSSAVFPSTVDKKYASENPAKARLHTCADQYKANKASNGNGGLKWIQKGGGYWSECNKKLKG